MTLHVADIHLRHRLVVVAAVVAAFSAYMAGALVAARDTFKAPSFGVIFRLLPSGAWAAVYASTALLLVTAIGRRSDDLFRAGVIVHSATVLVWAGGFGWALCTGQSSGPTGVAAWGLLAFHGFWWTAAPAVLKTDR